MRSPGMGDPEFRSLLVRAAVACLIALAVLLAAQWRLWQHLHQDLVTRDLALVATLQDGLPVADAMTYLTQPPNPQRLQAGLDLAARYGYTPDLPLNEGPVTGPYYRRSLALSLILACALVAGLLALLAATGRSHSARLRKMAGAVEQVTRGDFDLRLPAEGEGDLALLGFQINQMARRLQLTLGQLQEEKAQLKETVSHISHQLKTPLASLRAFNDLLLDGAAEDPVVGREFLERSRQQISRMEWMVHTLLRLSRLEAGVLAINLKPGDLAATVQEVVDALAVRAQARGQALQLHGAGAPLMLRHDADWLGEALANVIKNAIDYSPDGGRVEVSIAREPSVVRITVRDWGVGIAGEDLPHIFDRFYSGSRTRGHRSDEQGNGGGTGIGLALARLVVERHGGLIAADSRPGEGTTVTVTLPGDL
ncbi:MAG TPA: HAMP domain-containing sensor histidine kinase, partial [Symbiobacteriaceae bacterium]|nr:HAMP domain-containing sensor histidine kinase [Symbiobacteriaceae bacterium]